MQDKELSSDAFQKVHDRHINEDPQRVASLQVELLRAELAEQIRNLRTNAGMTREQLASRVRVTGSVIDDLEQARYKGDLLSMAARVAAVLHRSLEIRFVPMEGTESDSVVV